MSFENPQEIPSESQIPENIPDVSDMPAQEKRPKKVKKIETPEERRAVMQKFSHAYERFAARAKRPSPERNLHLEKLSKNEAVKGYLETKQDIEALNLQKDYGDAKKNEIAASLKESFDDLIASALEYVKVSDYQEEYAREHGSSIDEETKAMLEEIDGNRTNTHNILMGNLNIMKFYLDAVSIDNKILHAIIEGDRKLNLGDQRPDGDRRRVEAWARNIAQYLATLSETTT